MARWATPGLGGAEPLADRGYYAKFTVLALDFPFTVIPRHIQQAGRIVCTPAPSKDPPPRWRGVPCQWVNSQMWLRNDVFPNQHPDAWMLFSVLALLPDVDPPGPPPFLYLGTNLFTHHSQLRVTLRYGDIQYTQGPHGPDPVPYSDCGDITA